jgi:protein-tyrosine sulfotransferase
LETQVYNLNICKFFSILILFNIYDYVGSGTALMKTILDVSPKMDCNHETVFVPAILRMRRSLLKILTSRKSSYKTYYNVSHDAIRLFIIKMIEKGDPSHEILCAKDPATIENIDYLAELFPNIRIVLMVRDGRGSALSIMNRKKLGMKQDTFLGYISKWNNLYKHASDTCINIGGKKCMMVKYEDLVTKSETTIRNILNFVNIEFEEKFLHHEQQSDAILANSFKNKTAKEIYTDKLNSWEGVIKYDKSKLKEFEMFERLGYEI